MDWKWGHRGPVWPLSLRSLCPRQVSLSLTSSPETGHTQSVLSLQAQAQRPWGGSQGPGVTTEKLAWINFVSMLNYDQKKDINKSETLSIKCV